MDREFIIPQSEQHWLELRIGDLTSTMVPALFGLSPYMTEFELYHSKVSGLDLSIKENERMRKGKRLEKFAAEEVGVMNGWKVRNIEEYIRIPSARVGSSFDYEVDCPERGKGILEIKAVDFFQHKQKWVDDQAPEHIEIQLQHQLEVADKYDWGVIAAFTSIYDYTLYFRERDREMGAALMARCAKFWQDVETRTEPKPDFANDAWAIGQVYRGDKQDTLDVTKDQEFDVLAGKYLRLKDEAKQLDEELEATKAQLWLKAGDHKQAYGSKYKLTAGTTKDTKGTLITQAMVGMHVGGRSGYRQCIVKDLTQKKGTKDD